MNDLCLFVSDLHGKVRRFEKLFSAIEELVPAAVFLGGDILPSSILHSFRTGDRKPDFISGFLASHFSNLKSKMGYRYPRIFIIMGNDDPRIEEESLKDFERKGLWEYVHDRIVDFEGYNVMGYSFVPPTPFMLKDWERYDMDTIISPLSIHPANGFQTVKQQEQDKTIHDDLTRLGHNLKFDKTICLFHSPPYNSGLDKVDTDNLSIGDKMLDVNVGSKAISLFIKQKQPYITLHGHIHESSRLTGIWKQQINDTVSISAAYDGTGLALIRFHVSNPLGAVRMIL